MDQYCARGLKVKRYKEVWIFWFLELPTYLIETKKYKFLSVAVDCDWENRYQTILIR
jgi:hypothetical protein